MGFLAALPWGQIIPAAGSLLGGIFGGKKAQSSAQKRSPEEQQALGGAQGAVGNLGNQGMQLSQMGMPATQGATNYWSTLLHGNRAAMSQATAGPRAALTDVYRGAGSNLERSGIRGASRDRMMAELGRDQASKIAGLTTGVQPGAAQELGALGTNLTAQGTNAIHGAGGLYQQLLGQGFQNRTYARGEGEKAGAGIGNLLSGLPWGDWFKKKSSGNVDDLWNTT